MLFRETVIAGASGSLGGITASHNRFGAYLRARVVPTNPNTGPQAEIRTLFGQLANLWANTLTAAQRDAWNVYAANVPVLNRIGASVYLTGANHYIRSNVPRLQNGLTRADGAPPYFNLGEFTAVTAVGAATTDTVAIDIDNTDDWANEDDAAMIVQASRPVQNTINFWRGPYRLLGKVDGDSTTPPTTPASFTSPHDLTATQLVYCRIRVTRADARLSAPQYVQAIVQAV